VAIQSPLPLRRPRGATAKVSASRRLHGHRVGYDPPWLHADLPLGSVDDIDEFEEVPGLGIRCNVDGHDLVIGSKRWLRQNSVKVHRKSKMSPNAVEREDFPSPTANINDGATAAFTTEVFVSIDGLHRAILTVGDSPRVRP